MTINETQQPYEFLVRWNGSILTGSHVKFKTVLDRDGVVFQETEGPALPVGTEGFPLSDIINLTLQEALQSIDVLTNELSASKAETESAIATIVEKDSELEAKQSDLDTALAEITRLSVTE